MLRLASGREADPASRSAGSRLGSRGVLRGTEYSTWEPWDVGRVAHGSGVIPRCVPVRLTLSAEYNFSSDD